jgi:hypothetical protein
VFVERAQRKSQDRSGIGSANQQWKLGQRTLGLRFERVDPLPFGVSSLAHVGVIGFGDQNYSQMSELFLLLLFFLGRLGSMGFLRGASSSRDLQSYPGQCRTMQNNPGRCRTIQGNAGCCRAIQDVPRDYRIEQDKAEPCRKMQRYAATYRERSCGKVEFCLPTKLHAPSLADRVIGRMGHTLNAFGLFAREAQETLEDRRSDLGARDSRMGDLIHRLTCGSPRADKLIAATNAFFPETESRQIRRSAQFRS